jgi:predicted nucleic acid-binding protein
MRLYLDTNVIMDFLRDRDSAAYRLLVRALRCEHEILLSELTLLELARHHAQADIRSFVMFGEASGKLRLVRVEDADCVKAGRLRTHYADALHYTLAMRHADALVTRNSKDFPFPGVLSPDDIC